ncbi:hypothetical protein Tco_0578762, partial [Tanacetum coccineum]
MMTGIEFDIEKFEGKNDFGLWQVRMKALLVQQGLELHTATIMAYDNVIRKKAYSTLILCLGDQLVGDLAAIDTAISDENQELLLLISLPSSYDNFVETLLYGRDTLNLEDVLATLNSRELQKMTEAKGDGGEELSGSGSRDDGYGNADVITAMSVEELLDWIMDSGSSYFITYRRYYFVDFKWLILKSMTVIIYCLVMAGNAVYEGQVCSRMEFRRNLISMGTLKKKGFTMRIQSVKIKVIKGSLMVLSGTRRANCVYTLDDQVMTRKTLKGRKQLGEYQTGWKIKMGNVLDFCNKISTQQCTKSEVAKHLGVAVIQQQNRLVKETNVTLLAK